MLVHDVSCSLSRQGRKALRHPFQLYRRQAGGYMAPQSPGLSNPLRPLRLNPFLSLRLITFLPQRSRRCAEVFALSPRALLNRLCALIPFSALPPASRRLYGGAVARPLRFMTFLLRVAVAEQYLGVAFPHRQFHSPGRTAAGRAIPLLVIPIEDGVQRNSAVA